ncbi:trypsin II-P29-like [Eurosta solidaginis]|uniref:trypsin II-P29-like n=1 Tax=Eurosta solidaginis TaxID=178769 RepID=UPI0035314430
MCNCCRKCIILIVFSYICRGQVISGSRIKRIVGGVKVPHDQHVPYIVSIEFFGQQVLGGSIIGPSTILTVAHWLEEIKAWQLTVRAGTKDICSKTGMIVKVQATHCHPFYDKENDNNDIGLVRLAQALEYNDDIQPIKIFGGVVKTDEKAFVAGWGVEYSGGHSVCCLNMLEVRIIDQQVCSYVWPHLTDGMICAGHSVDGKDTCIGDSGGPLVVNGLLVGITSHGPLPCGDKSYPGIYTRITKFIPWLEWTLNEYYYGL